MVPWYSGEWEKSNRDPMLRYYITNETKTESLRSFLLDIRARYNILDWIEMNKDMILSEADYGSILTLLQCLI